MSASITATYDYSPSDKPYFGYALKVTVTAASGLPPEIFVYQRGAAPAPIAGAEVTDTFICIADPLDLEEIPVGTPDLKAEIPYYRTTTVTLYTRDADTRAELARDIKSDIAGLVDALNNMVTVETTETVTYPEA